MSMSVPSVSISYKHFVTYFFRRNVLNLDSCSDDGQEKLPLLLKFHQKSISILNSNLFFIPITITYTCT